jgi:hypothetical protein
MRAGVAQGGLVSLVLFSLYVNDIATSSRHVDLAQYVDDTALVATSRSPSLLVGHLEAYLDRLECWLRDWTTAINVSNSIAVLFGKAAWRILKTRAVQFVAEPIQWVEAARYLGATLDTQLTWWERRQLKDWACLAPSLTGEAACPSETVCCSTSSSSVLWWITHFRSGGPLPAATFGIFMCYNPSIFALRLTHLGTLVTGKFTRIWGFHSSPTLSLTESFDSKLADAGNPFVRQLGRHLCRPRADWSHPRVTEVHWCSTSRPRLSIFRQPSRRNE